MNPSQSAWAILQKYWPNQLTQNIRVMKVRKDNLGVLFDIYED